MRTIPNAMTLNGQPARTEDIQALALYGYANFTTMLVQKMGVRGLDLHMKRLNQDAQQLFGTGIDTSRVRHYLRQTLHGYSTPVVARVTVFSKHLDIAQPLRCSRPDILITTRPAPQFPQQPLALQSTIHQRELPLIKSAGLSGALLKRRHAMATGFDDALFTTENHEIAEGPTWNIGFISEETVYVPAAPSLPGITMQLLTAACRKHSITVAKKHLYVRDIPNFKAAFVASAVTGIRAVDKIDDHRFTPGQLLATLQQLYDTIPLEDI